MVRFVVGFIGAVLLALLVLAAWLAVTGWQAKSAADDLQSEVALAVADGNAGELAAAMERFPTIAGHASSVDSKLNSIPWTWAADFPAVGDTVAALATLSEATAQTLTASQNSGALELDLSQTLDVTLLDQVAPALDEMADTASTYVEPVHAIDPDDGVGPLQPQITEARDQFLSVATGVEAAAGAARSLPTVLGYEGKRRSLVVLQNTAEARGRRWGPKACWCCWWPSASCSAAACC